MGKHVMWESIQSRSDKTQHPDISFLGRVASDIVENIKILRIRHWIKNFLLFAAPFFGGSLFMNETLLMAIPVFLAFSFCASSVYIFNDLNDYQNDRLHPTKKKRPIASNRISMTQAYLLCIVMMVPSLILSYSISPDFFYLIIAYIVLQVAYSLRLKHIAVVDIFCIAAGFVIRVLAGGAVFRVEVSHWLLLSMFMISLVLASGKRVSEVSLLQEDAPKHRKSLDNETSASILGEILIISSAASLIAYALYTVEMYQNLIYTIPIGTFGLFRYIVLAKQGMGDPTHALTKDRWLMATIGIWLSVVGWIRYL